MIHVYHDLCCDFMRPEYPRLLRLWDGGTGLHQHITVHLFANGIPEAVSDGTFALHWQKGDGSTGDIDMDAVCDCHKVTFELPREVLVGNPEVNVSIHIQDNGSILHTFRLLLYVEQLPDGANIF